MHHDAPVNMRLRTPRSARSLRISIAGGGDAAYADRCGEKDTNLLRPAVKRTLLANVRAVALLHSTLKVTTAGEGPAERPKHAGQLADAAADFRRLHG